MVDAEGRFAGIHGSTRDISERARLERELRESEERYRYLVASSPDLVWLTDAEGTLTFISDAARTMLGSEPTELMGRPYADIFAPSARRDAAVRFRWLARHPSAVHRMRLPFLHSDGHEVLVEINGTGMTADGAFIGAHGAARDVSERDRLERDLRRQAGELAAGEERAHLARELHDSVTQALFSMTLVSRSVELLLDRDPEAAQGPARAAARPPARGAGRDARADLRAPPGQPRAGRADAGRCGPTPRRSRAGSACRSSSRARSTSACRCRSRRSSTGSRRRRCTTSSSTPARARSGSRSAASPAASGCGSATTARASTRRASPTAISGWPGCAPGPTRSGRASRSRACPGQGTTIEVVVPDAAIAAGGADARSRPTGLDPRRMT